MIPRGAARHALLDDSKAKTRRGESYDVFLGSSDAVLRAKKPARDSIFAKTASKKKYRPAYDPQTLAIRFKGKTIVPTFNPENGFYEYRAKGRMIGSHQDYYLPDELRKNALDSLLNRRESSTGPRKPIR